MPHIDYYFATLSPYTYLAGTKLEEIAAKHGATITYKPCDMGGIFSRTGGVALPDRHPNRLAYRAQDLVRSAKKLGMAFNLKPQHWPVNMAPSSYALIAAQNAGGGDMGALVHGITRACWAEEKDIADDAVIRDCLSAAGFDPEIADKGLLVGAETYSRNLDDAVEAGVFGAPFYVVDNDARFWGRDRLEDLDLYLAGEL